MGAVPKNYTRLVDEWTFLAVAPDGPINKCPINDKGRRAGNKPPYKLIRNV